jgi:8-oxo-dGTP pyrophosphatase MutT (NUDIX family)
VSGGTFRRTGEEIVHRGYAIEVVVARYEAPDGHEFTRDVVRHPGAVAVLPLHDDGSVTMVRQYRAPIEEELLEIPAGLRDVEGEDLLVTAERELAEEVGLSATTFERLGEFHVAAGITDELVHLYLATGLGEVDADNQGPEEEAMTVERHPLDDVVAMIERGEVTDAKTIISVLLVASRGR